jgi:hypothetical protein
MIEGLFRTLIVAAFICSTLSFILDTAASPLYAADDEQSTISVDDSQNDIFRFSRLNSHKTNIPWHALASQNELIRFERMLSPISPTDVATNARRDFIQTLRWWRNPP